MQLFNRRWGSARQVFGSDARKQTPNLEIQTCFHPQLFALDYIVPKHAPGLNKLWLLLRPALQRR